MCVSCTVYTYKKVLAATQVLEVAMDANKMCVDRLTTEEYAKYSEELEVILNDNQDTITSGASPPSKG